MLEPDLPGRDCALFFDFDGTLVELAALPGAVVIDPGLPRLLQQVSAALDGALAIVSGRPLSEIDQFLQPLTLCAAGVHGAERRGADGHVRRFACPGLHDAVAVVQALCLRHPVLHMEVKPCAIALHYRQAPELEDQCLMTMTEVLRLVDGMALMRGKMVVEIKPRRAGKGVAVRSFVDEPPFRQRRPWVFGDDVTDEAAFEAVLALGGVAVKVGQGDTLATHRLPDPAAVRDWLARLADQLASAPAQKVAS